jgi:hypothetical protein
MPCRLRGRLCSTIGNGASSVGPASTHVPFASVIWSITGKRKLRDSGEAKARNVVKILEALVSRPSDS